MVGFYRAWDVFLVHKVSMEEHEGIWRWGMYPIDWLLPGGACCLAAGQATLTGKELC